jgi:glucose/arabinose dehydrogenase
MAATVLAGGLSIAVAFAHATGAPAPARSFATEAGTVEVIEFARGLNHPWGLAFLPDGRCSSPSARADSGSSTRPGRSRHR